MHLTPDLKPSHSTFLLERISHIGLARQALLYGDPSPSGVPGASVSGGVPLVESWIQRSWQRSLSHGHRPDHAPHFDTISAPALRYAIEANRTLVQHARSALEKLSHAVAGTRYFAILTNQHGVVVDTGGVIDRSDRRADLITRIGTDLSERQLATTAIGAALAEMQPVWLHRGEHFFETNSVYSCAGAPLFGPDGACVGMLDLTGIEAAERPELKHLVAQSARSIENALTLNCINGPRDLLIRLNWPGHALGDETDGLVCLDADGFVTAANQTARQMVPQLARGALIKAHCSDLFAIAFETLFDAAHRTSNTAQPLELPLWTGLRLHARTNMRGEDGLPTAMQASLTNTPQAPAPRHLKEIENALILKAVQDARGNVMQAASALGVSRATVYRRLGTRLKRP